MAAPILFDAVLFDLDGTLVATDRFWLPAARIGCRRAFEELGIDRPIPPAAEWLSLVGHPFPEALEGILPDLPPRARRRVGERCLEEEQRLLTAGGAALMPGAADLLAELGRAGVRTAIASNCSRSYLDHMLAALGLGELVDGARCLDSPGVTKKSDMLAELLVELGTRSAVMVGDRLPDRDAAHDNGLPHVHCSFGFAGAGEETLAEEVIHDLGELPQRLRRRASWLREALEEAGFLRSIRCATGPPPALGITGPPLAGKTLFARDAARVLASLGVPARVVALDDFGRAGGPAADPLARAFDLEGLIEGLLVPHGRGEVGRAGGREIQPGEVLLLEGPYLLDPRLRLRLERVIHLHVADEVGLRRACGRVPAVDRPGALIHLRRHALGAQRAFEELHDPATLADLVLDASNPLGGRRAPALKGRPAPG